MINVKNELAKIQCSAQTDPRFKHHEEVVITKEAENHVARLFNSMLPNFPAWRQTCPDQESLGRMKLAYTKAIMRHEQSTGKELNIKAGLLACEKSDSDWMPSAGKFIKWCEQSDDLIQFAKRALSLFNRAQRQIDSIGQMVVKNHSFELKRLTADKTEKQFIELYLSCAQDNAIQMLDAFAITETVQLSEEQLKDKQRRIQTAQNEHLSKMNSLFGKPAAKIVEKEVKSVGVKKGSLKVFNKSAKQIEDEKQRQLKAVGLR